MARQAAQTVEQTLGIVDEDYDVEMLRAVEASFGVTFDVPVSWVTVGDAYDALMAKLPATEIAGKCATTMAFYRLRRALMTVLEIDMRIGPRTPLRDLTRRPVKKVLRELSLEMMLPIVGFTLSWIGGVGLLLVLVGILASLASLGLHSAWPLIGLLPLGLGIVAIDPGAFGNQTVGDMARSLAVRNYSAFAGIGADRRPAAIWAAFVDLLGEVAELSPAGIDRQTRL